MNNFLAEKLGSMFANALTEVISVTMGQTVSVLSSADDTEFYRMSGAMVLNGRKPGILFISAEESVIRGLFSNMTGIKEGIEKGDINDMMWELVNMTAGNAKLRFSDPDYIFDYSSPFIIEGDNASIIVKRMSAMISRTVGNEDFRIKLKIVY